MTFFVYGTLRGGHELMRGAAFLGTARMPGCLYMVGHSYPGLTPARCEEDWVKGELYRVDSPATVLQLDAYEGHAYSRKRATAHRDSGERVEAWVYFYKGPVREDRRIPSGDFLLIHQEN